LGGGGRVWLGVRGGGAGRGGGVGGRVGGEGSGGGLERLGGSSGYQGGRCSAGGCLASCGAISVNWMGRSRWSARGETRVILCWTGGWSVWLG